MSLISIRIFSCYLLLTCFLKPVCEDRLSLCVQERKYNQLLHM